MIGAMLAGVLIASPASADDEAKEAASSRLNSVVGSCFASSGSIGGGRVELDAQAFDGELVSLMFTSELGNTEFSDCLCRRAVGALGIWSSQVEGGGLLSLPFVLGSVVSTDPEQRECYLELAAPEEVKEEAILPAGQLTLSKLKANGFLTDEVVSATLASAHDPLERCYRADLIRWPEYADSAKLEMYVAADGSVSVARIDGLTYNSISNCQIQHLLQMSWPTAEDGTTITAKLAYTVGE
ncbi:MAG: hypothetical protein P8R54_24495 [Myxococcota bacterium]|nr:hypothetical protein [Myxococcota bacterium]